MNTALNNFGFLLQAGWQVKQLLEASLGVSL